MSGKKAPFFSKHSIRQTCIAIVTMLFLLSTFVIQLEGNRALAKEDDSLLCEVMIWLNTIAFFLDNFFPRTFSTVEGLSGQPNEKIKAFKQDRQPRCYDLPCKAVAMLTTAWPSLMSGSFVWHGLDKLSGIKWLGLMLFFPNTVVSYYFRYDKANMSITLLCDRLVKEPVYKKMALGVLLAGLVFGSSPYAKYYENVYTKVGFWSVLGYFTDWSPRQAEVIIGWASFVIASFNFAVSNYSGMLDVLSRPGSYLKEKARLPGASISTVIGTADFFSSMYFSLKIFNFSLYGKIVTGAYAPNFLVFYILNNSFSANARALQLCGCSQAPNDDSSAGRPLLEPDTIQNEDDDDKPFLRACCLS